MIKEIEKEVNAIETWIRRVINDAHAEGVVVGNSGGKDSATVIALAAKALGNEKVLAVAMPCQSKEADLEDAKLVAEKFNVKMETIDLTNVFESLEMQIDEKVSSTEEWRRREAKINSKPRIRMTTLYYIAQNLNYLVIGTGNKCESVVGYTTKWGDSAHDFNPIGEFTVDEVLQIGEYLGVPSKIIKKAPSDGLGGATDEEKLGVTYKQIAEYIETGKTEEKALKIIKEKEEKSMHKRNPIPVYHRIKYDI